jgi:hypothetical protein
VKVFAAAILGSVLVLGAEGIFSAPARSQVGGVGPPAGTSTATIPPLPDFNGTPTPTPIVSPTATPTRSATTVPGRPTATRTRAPGRCHVDAHAHGHRYQEEETHADRDSRAAVAQDSIGGSLSQH